MSGYSRLWKSIRTHVGGVRKMEINGFPDDPDQIKLTYRTAQIFTLDAFLHEHRKKFGSNVFPLHGEDALHHKILIKYKWPLATTRALPLSDCLLAIQDELVLSDLPERPRDWLNRILQEYEPMEFDDLLDEEWNPAFAELFLREQQ